MKRRFFLLLALASVHVWAADAQVYQDGQERALSQARGTVIVPRSQGESAPWTDRQRCTYEGNLLQMAAINRDRGTREHDTLQSIAGVIEKSHRYSSRFATSAPSRVHWIYENSWAAPDSVQMGYLKECDPAHFN